MTTDQTDATIEVSSADLSPNKVVFTLDSKTLLFKTHKSEDVSVLQNRVSLIEIHEVLMEINLNLIPLIKVIQRAYIWYVVGLGVSALLILLMLLMQQMKLVKPFIYSFIGVNVWLIGIVIARKIAYDRVINRVLREKEELYRSNGLNWVLKNSYFSFSQSDSCWLELQLDIPLDIVDTTDRNARIEVDKAENTKNTKENENHQEEQFAELYKSQKAPVGTARRLQVASNFTLGPGMSKQHLSTHNTPHYAAIDVGFVESSRVRKPSH